MSLQTDVMRSYWALLRLSSRLIIYTLQFTLSLAPDAPPPTNTHKKKALATPQCLSNKSQEEVIVAHFLMHFKSLCNTKLTHLFRMGLALVMLALNGNLVCRAFIIWATTKGFLVAA